jgi:hypothetical protein
MNDFPPRPDRGDPNDPIERIPEVTEGKVRIDTRNDFDVSLADLVVTSCVFDLPLRHDHEINYIDIPEHIRPFFHRILSVGQVNAEIKNVGNVDATEFDVRVTVGIADPDLTAGRYVLRTPIVVRERTISELKVGKIVKISEPYIPIGRVTEGVYIAVVEVNPMTREFPLGKVIESNYVNNRCGCTWYDHPEQYTPGGPHLPEIPPDEDLEPPDPPIRK